MTDILRDTQESPLTTQSTSTGFGYGKVILFGEHAVVFGKPALAAGIEAGVRAIATPGNGRVRIPTWGVDVRTSDGSVIGGAVDRIVTRLGAKKFDFTLDTGIPCRAGLGSSAAMAVAIARAAAMETRASDAEVAAAVDESESVFHGSPSGIDAAASLSGRVGTFRKGEGWKPVALAKPITLCVGLSGKPRDTATQVDAVSNLCGKLPIARGIIDTLGDVTLAGTKALVDGQLDDLGRLFDVAHGLLASLGVSSRELDALVHAARVNGALGAKLTGAGGGGAVIALVPTRARDVLAGWRALGFDGFETSVRHV